MSARGSAVPPDAERNSLDLFHGLAAIQARQLAGEGPSRSEFDDLLDLMIQCTGSAFGFVAEVFRSEATGDPYIISRAVTDIAWNDEVAHALSEQLAAGGARFDQLNTLYGEALTSEQVVISNSPTTDSRSGGLPAGHPPLVSYLGIPVHADGELVALVSLAGRQAGYGVCVAEELQPAITVAGLMVRQLRERRENQATVHGLRVARSRSHYANIAKTSLLANVSHELRTPLNSLLGFSRLLESEGDPSAMRMMASRVADAGEHLTRIVDDILDEAAIETGRLSSDLAPVAVVEVVKSCMEIVRMAADARDIVLQYEVRPDDLTVIADDQRLRQVMLNLLSNAVKFTRESSPISVIASARDSQTAEIVVEDSGFGISMAEADRALVPHGSLGGGHVHDASSDEVSVSRSGLGLGLARSMAEAMGARLELSMSGPNGSRFTLTLPRCAPASPDQPRIRPHETEGQARRAVLYIEDSVGSLEVVMRAIVRELPNASIFTAASVEEGVRAAEDLLPDVLLLDMNLPDGTALDVLDRLGIGPASATAAILLSANGDLASRQAAVAHGGVRAFLGKPVDLEELIAVLRPLLAP